MYDSKLMIIYDNIITPKRKMLDLLDHEIHRLATRSSFCPGPPSTGHTAKSPICWARITQSFCFFGKSGSIPIVPDQIAVFVG